MKIRQEYKAEGDKLIVKKTHDYTPELKYARVLRDAGKQAMGESRLIGTIPASLVNEWLKEAGVSWDDTEARQEVVKRKILSGEFDKFRVWEGTY